jgi:exodeoxyribonuclease V alpha subunit
MKNLIIKLHEQNIFSDIDIQFAQFITALAGEINDDLHLSAALLSYFTMQGHICIELAALAEQTFPSATEPSPFRVTCPPLTRWLESLYNSRVVGKPGEYTPLILDEQHRLYLYKYWDYEQQLAALIRQRLMRTRNDVDFKRLAQGLSRLFPAQNQTDSENRQKMAVEIAIQRNFCLISGGPGTGKTAIIIKILSLLLEQDVQLNIALAAPTGKAAIRLQESITQALPQLNCAPAIKAAIPQETYTIHRLLGMNPDAPAFYHHANYLLPYDVVIVDEASMIDLALMTRLAQAVPFTARWILLGDKDQLASVEAGTVLGDICEVGKIPEEAMIVRGEKQSQTIKKALKVDGKKESHLEQSKEDDLEKPGESQSDLESETTATLMAASIVLLDHSYRFSENSGIWQLAQAVKSGDGDQALQILASDDYPDVHWHHLGISERLTASLLEPIISHLTGCLKESAPEKVLQQFEKFRILCATRRGLFGVANINRQIAIELNKKRLIRSQSRWYHGRPIMITRNDYTLKLFNGDIGILLHNPNNYGELQAFFPAPAGQVRIFWPNRLPEHETVYAMTIHKSQGSEFDHVFILLPSQLSPVLTRELIYTGITRARQSVTIVGAERIFKAAIATQIRRTSGLQQALGC